MNVPMSHSSSKSASILLITSITVSVFAIAHGNELPRNEIRIGDQENEIGIQFLFDDDAAIDEVIRRSKIMSGRCRFGKMDGKHHVFKLMGPGFNYAPRQLFRSRDIRIDLGALDSEEIDRAVIVLRESDDGTYELIGYQTDRPTNQKLFLAFSNKRAVFNFGEQLYKSKKYRYEKLVESLIKQLKHADENEVEIIYRLQKLGDDAREAIGPIQLKVKQFKEPAKIAAGVIALAELGEKAAVKPVLAHAMPLLTKELHSETNSARNDCLIACHLGLPTDKAINTICNALNDLEERRKRKAVASSEQFESAVVPMIESLAFIGATHRDSVATFRSFANHESVVIRKAAQRALKSK